MYAHRYRKDILPGDLLSSVFGTVKSNLLGKFLPIAEALSLSRESDEPPCALLSCQQQIMHKLKS